MENIMKGAGTFAITLDNWDQVEEGVYAIAGSPKTVREKLEQHLPRLGTGNLLGLFQLGTLPEDLTRRSLELFAREVMPALRERFPDGKPMLETTGAVA
jgi:alkanesulfonate monooxygenase SsuD/methylene tetrahydromethanopterin reductase-like flavin-dependent oxidoreductase (luciferase family)